tara:strand:- start:299 stop:625 length:327 start_codon:yes stop_codon:yes gene_type:complete
MSETIIGKTLTIEGEVSGTEPLLVMGTVKGKINLKNRVSIAQEGCLEAGVEAATLDVAGVVRGNVQVSELLEIKPGGRMEGDIAAPRVLIADGALYKGNIDMDTSSHR